MNAAEITAQIRQQVAGRDDVAVGSYPLKHAKGDFEFLRLASKEIRPGDKIVLIIAGIHGNEIAGPITLARRAGAIFDLAKAKGLKLIVYPLYNPSGFQAGTRYNIDGDEGDAGNQDFLRYETEDGQIIDDLGPSEEFKEWYWASDPIFGARLTLENRLAHELLRREPLKQIGAVLDLHQDYITEEAPPAAYHYAFGDTRPYLPVIRKIERLVKIMRRTVITAGYRPNDDAVGPQPDPKNASDENGFIFRHDGSLMDLMWRLGAKHCLTVETTGATPLDDAVRINMLWVEGLLEIAAADGGERQMAR